MNKIFSNILIPVFPVDGIDTDTEKAIEIVKQLQCNIHLLYTNNSNKISVLKKAGFLFPQRRRTKIFNDAALADLQKKRLLTLYPSLLFHYTRQNENLQQEISSYCNKHNIDLVLVLENKILVENGRQNKMNMGRLSEKLNCPILSMHIHSSILNIKNIVIPIGSFLPMRRLIVASYIGRIFHSKIHLISLNKKFLLHGRDEAVCLYRAYHLLHDNTNLDIECMTLTGRNIEQATLRYAEEISADLVVVNSESELLYTGMMN